MARSQSEAGALRGVVDGDPGSVTAWAAKRLPDSATVGKPYASPSVSNSTLSKASRAVLPAQSTNWNA